MNHPEKPNLLLVFPDQWRRKAISAYGDPNIHTPHIDQLAKDGINCMNANSSFPVCVPFRSTMMSGKPGGLAGVNTSGHRLHESDNVLARGLQAAGYESVYIGKWHLSKDRNHPIPRQCRGAWDRWRGFDHSNKPYETHLYFDDEEQTRFLEGHQIDVLFDLAEKELETLGKDKPFFMCLSIEPPHDVVPDQAHLNRNPLGIRDKFMYTASPEYAKKWEERKLELPSNWFPEPGDVHDYFYDALRGYYAMAEQIDARVGTIRDKLDDLGLSENTMILFFSDHGEMCGSHCASHKRYPYDESVGIPFIVYDPRRPQFAGTSTDLTICTEDICPTLLGYAGVTLKDRWGIDLSNYFQSLDQRPDREGVALEYVKFPNHGKLHSWVGWRDQNHTAAWIVEENWEWTPWLLFDRKQDPDEKQNLASSNEALMTRLKAKLLNRRKELGYTDSV